MQKKPILKIIFFVWRRRLALDFSWHRVSWLFRTSPGLSESRSRAGPKKGRRPNRSAPRFSVPSWEMRLPSDRPGAELLRMPRVTQNAWPNTHLQWNILLPWSPASIGVREARPPATQRLSPYWRPTWEVWRCGCSGRAGKMADTRLLSGALVSFVDPLACLAWPLAPDLHQENKQM